MKKLTNLYIIGGFVAVMIAFYGCIILCATGCEKTEIKPAITPEFICLPAYDSTNALQSFQAARSIPDGILNVVLLGNKFNNQTKNLFFQDCAWIMDDATTLHPVDSFNSIGEIQFTIKLAKGNFNCTAIGGVGSEALNCNWDKIIQAAGNSPQPDLIGVLSYGDGFGTGNTGIGVLGVGTNTTTTAIDLYYGCSLQYRITELFDHETWGHGTGCAHAFIPQYPNNIMSYAINGGCGLGNTFIPEHQQIISNYINSRIH